MKKKIAVATALAVSLLAGNAMADSIDGKFGISGYLGFQIPADATDNTDGIKLETEVAFTGGGGILYGIAGGVAAEVQVSHSTIDVDNPLLNAPKFETTNIDVGLQYRFMTDRKLVPYVGAGMTFLLPQFKEDKDIYDIDTAYGGFVKLGLDYFVNPHIALSAEVKQVIGPTVNIRDAAGPEGNFNPDALHSLFGLKYFF
jgi:outer membrane protein